jgi:DNA-binding protein YbaB
VKTPFKEERMSSVDTKVSEVKFDIEGGKAVVSAEVSVKHELVELEIPVKLKVSTSPIVDKVVEVIEEAIPGDQKALAEILKAKIKDALEKV